MKTALGRRFALMTMGLGMAAGAAGLASLHDGAARAAEPSLLPPEAKSLEELTARLSRAPRRRDFKFAEKLIATKLNPDELSHNALAAELTNHLITGVVLTPGIGGTLAELQ